MSLDSMISDGVYSTMVAEDATYVDASGAETAVRVVPDYNPDVIPDGITIGGLSSNVVFSIRRASVAQPAKGDVVIHDGKRYCVDGYQPAAVSTEWTLYVYEVYW